MGQYYKLACPETGTHVSAGAMGSFVKAYEQVWSTSQPAMLAYLLSAGRGNHPRDLPWAPQGLWAGRMPLMVGDYAQEGDLRGLNDQLGASEEDIYSNATDKQVMLDAKPARRKGLKDLSAALFPIYERSHGLRCTTVRQDGTTALQTQYGLTDFFPVKETSDGWDLNLDDVSEADRKDVMDYYERCGAFKDTAWQRGPIDVRPFLHFTPLAEVPETVPSADDGQGGAMIWVNLDRGEFIDPAIFGDTPDLVGVMNGDSAIAMKTPGLRDDISKITVEITPRTIIEQSLGGKEAMAGPIELAPTFDLFVDSGKVFIDAKLREEMAPLLAGLPSQTLKLRMELGSHHTHTIYYPAEVKAIQVFESNHDVIAACSMAA